MPKNTKSSATSATRKKHAKKFVPTEEEEQAWLATHKNKLTKQQKAKKKKEPRVKVYTPPVKPAPVQTDPLETTGLVHSLPPELLVVLRSFNKKAHVTKIRALEELQSGWIDKSQKEGEDGSLVDILIEMLPVWLHHLPALFVHSSRRVRLLAATAHFSFLQILSIRDQILLFIRETAPASQIETILGTWCIAAYDIEKSVSTAAIKSWIDIVSPDSRQDKLNMDEHRLNLLSSFVQRTILDPNEVYTYLNPVQPVVPPPPNKKDARKQEPDAAARSKAEELEESEQDRKARLRVGGFGALRWIIESPHFDLQGPFLDFLRNPGLWSSLYHAEQCPFVDGESFGYGQHVTRKAAWAVVQTLLSGPKARLEPLLPTLSVAVLRSAWVEPDPMVHAIMWQPLLRFLKEFPNAWEAERTYDYTKQEESEASEGEDSDEEDQKKERALGPVQSVAYHEFLKFLELGCSGSPLQGYPTVVIILSTIPSSILVSSTSSSAPLSDLFASFWKAVNSRAFTSLQRSATSGAFLSSLLESVVFLVKRLRNDARNGQRSVGSTSTNDLDVPKSLVCGQIEKVWTSVADNTLKIEQRAAARLVGQTLLSLNDVDSNLFGASWDTLTVSLRASDHAHPVLLSVFLKAFHDQFRHVPGLREAASALMLSILTSSLNTCADMLSGVQSDSSAAQLSQAELTKCTSLLVNMLDRFRDGLFSDAVFAKLVDDLVVQHGPLLLRLSSSLLPAYLTHRNDNAQTLQLWHSLLSNIAQKPEDFEQCITPLLDAAQGKTLPKNLKPRAGEVDVLVENLLAQILAGDNVQTPFVQRILQYPDYFLSEKGYASCLQSIEAVVSRHVDIALRDPEFPISTFEQPLGLVAALSQHPPRHLPEHKFDAVAVDVFIIAYLLPVCGDESQEDHSAFGTAKEIWDRWQQSPNRGQEEILERIKTKLRVILCDTQLRPFPRDVLEMLWGLPPGVNLTLPADIFPSPKEFEEWLDQLSPDPIHPSIAVVEPLIHLVSTVVKRPINPEAFDGHGFSTYARVVDALLLTVLHDRQIAKKNLWALWHFQALKLYAQDFIHVPGVPNEVFGAEAIHEGLENLVSKIEQVTTYVLTSLGDDEWRKMALLGVLSGKPPQVQGDLTWFLVDAIQRCRETENARNSRILRNILQHVFHGVTKSEAEEWLLLARKMEHQAPQTSMTVVYTITNLAPEPAQLDRYRNELAASLLGVPASKANTEGLLILQKLAACAPNPESDVVFLPQPRAVNIAKTCQQWIASDDDIEEEVESAITLIFYHLAPILQDIPGAHWNLVFDILENNLENSSFTDDLTLVTLSRTLRLIVLIQDLAATNKSLRADWEERNVPILTLVRNLAISPLDDNEVSVPRSTCRRLNLTILKNLPPFLIDQNTFSKVVALFLCIEWIPVLMMCHLVMDPLVDVQKMGYQFLKSGAQKRTEHLVIEAAVDSETSFVAQLPAELVAILQYTIASEESTSESHNLFGYLLAWMLLFDLFQDSVRSLFTPIIALVVEQVFQSLRVRSSYIEQLRNIEVVLSHFIPTILALLRLDQGPLRVFKLEVWAVDDFYIEHFEASSDFGLPVLAAHLFYRALLNIPSLIHTWILDCKDRQLSSTITDYTSQHFSPVIIQTELAHIKSPEAVAILVDDNLSIKVSNSANEVTASYSVDEHQLEIKLKIPPDWPLHKMEIKDMKRVGVDENRWRAWILAVQQIIWSQNGRIVDGLNLFKRNVTLHFQGQVECAICYSIISVMDGSLPRKPCRTCKNRFHAGCLYKWFNSSHSSSCPLCRSDIF